MVANQRIHDRVLKRMPHMQASSYVWGWYDNAIGITLTLGFKIALIFPVLIPRLLYRLWVIGFVHCLVWIPVKKEADYTMGYCINALFPCSLFSIIKLE
jgi:hypothetical protein